MTTADTSVPLEWSAVFFPRELCSDWNHHQEMNLVCISCLRLRSLCATAQPRTAGEGRTEGRGTSEVQRSLMRGLQGGVYQPKQDSLRLPSALLISTLESLLTSAAFHCNSLYYWLFLPFLGNFPDVSLWKQGQSLKIYCIYSSEEKLGDRCKIISFSNFATFW